MLLTSSEYIENDKTAIASIFMVIQGHKEQLSKSLVVNKFSRIFLRGKFIFSKKQPSKIENQLKSFKKNFYYRFSILEVIYNFALHCTYAQIILISKS